MIHSTRRATFGPELQSTTMISVFLRGNVVVEARLHGNQRDSANAIVILEARIGDTTINFHAQDLKSLQRFSNLISSVVESIQTDEPPSAIVDAPPTDTELTAAAAYSSADLPF